MPHLSSSLPQHSHTPDKSITARCTQQLQRAILHKNFNTIKSTFDTDEKFIGATQDLQYHTNHPYLCFGYMPPIDIAAIGKNFGIIRYQGRCSLAHVVELKGKPFTMSADPTLRQSHIFILYIAQINSMNKADASALKVISKLANILNATTDAQSDGKSQQLLSINHDNFSMPYAYMELYFKKNPKIYSAIKSFMRISYLSIKCLEQASRLYKSLELATPGMEPLILDYLVSTIGTEARTLQLLSLLLSSRFPDVRLTHKAHQIMYATLEKIISQSTLESYHEALGISAKQIVALGYERIYMPRGLQLLTVHIFPVEQIIVPYSLKNTALRQTTYKATHNT